jgi:hypothetical protein
MSDLVSIEVKYWMMLGATENIAPAKTRIINCSLDMNLTRPVDGNLIIAADTEII